MASTTTLQEQARALGDPTRHSIFQHLVDAGRPLGVAELTERLDCTHNAVRQHLAKLVTAGLVVEATAPPAGPGRPRLVYEPDAAAVGQWGGAGPYERLSRLLVEVITSGDGPEVVGRRAADDLRAPVPTGDPVEDLRVAMARQGFEPMVRATRGGDEVVLQRCPFASAALADRQTVCLLHLGIADGLVEDTDAAVSELVAHDPRRAGCRIRLSPAAAPTEGGPTRLTLRGTAARR